VHFLTPLDNPVYRKSFRAHRKNVVRPHAVVDITGGYPVILMEIDPSTSSLKKSYLYVADPMGADRQILAQHDGGSSAAKYFYLHDRLGSVRLVLADGGSVAEHYTYEPFGQVIEPSDGPPVTSDAFMFTGQYFDSEIQEYHLRARQYNPHIAGFTSRATVAPYQKEPVTNQ